MNGKKKNSLSQIQTIRLAEKLKEVCAAKDGIAVYSEGWDDANVIKALGPEYNLNNVMNLRKLLFGDLAPKKKTKAATLAELQARIEALETWAAARPVQRFVRKDIT